MTLKPFSLAKYPFIMTLTVGIEQCEKVNLFKPNTPQNQTRRFKSHAPLRHVARLNEPRAYIQTPLYSDSQVLLKVIQRTTLGTQHIH